MTGRARVVLFDDGIARDWAPFTLTRPAGELLFGAHTQRARAERVLGLPCEGHLAAPHLAGFEEQGAPPVLEAAPAPGRPTLFLCSRVVPDWGCAWCPGDAPASLHVDGHPMGWYAPGGEAPPAAFLNDPEAYGGAVPARVDVAGSVLAGVDDLVVNNGRQVALDFAAARARSVVSSTVLSRAATIGPAADRFLAERGVAIEPGVVLDFTAGPIWLGEDVTVRAFTRLAGPAYIGNGSTLLGGTFTGLSAGPVCRLHGEVEESVILGYSNKAHDGFLGHAYLGRWVNLGALTTNSDLKNNYGTVRISTPRGVVDTGQMKIGCFLGDHARTGIGVMLNTGTIVGAGSNLYGATQPPKLVPPFSWGSGSELTTHDADRFLETAATVMGRRGLELTVGMRGMLRRAHELARRG